MFKKFKWIFSIFWSFINDLGLIIVHSEKSKYFKFRKISFSNVILLHKLSFIFFKFLFLIQMEYDYHKNKYQIFLDTKLLKIGIYLNFLTQIALFFDNHCISFFSFSSFF